MSIAQEKKDQAKGDKKSSARSGLDSARSTLLLLLHVIPLCSRVGSQRGTATSIPS